MTRLRPNSRPLPINLGRPLAPAGRQSQHRGMGEQRLWRSLLQVCAALALVCPTGTRAQPTSAETAERAIAEIDSDLIRAQTKGYGGAVIIEQDGKTLLSKGYGLADRKHRRPFTPDTIAQIGSITKSQTGAALATLIAEGKVSLSDPVSKFIPEAPEPGRSRTISQLASHRSGLLDACTEDFEPQSEAMLIRKCLAKPLAHAPGEENYSNMGYSVLALIIERATGVKFVRFTILSNQSPDFATNCPDGAYSGCQYTDLTEIEVMGAPAA